MSTQREMQFQSGPVRLAGTLHLPVGETPVPAVAMIQGSGRTNRDAEGYFLPFREAFLARGVAVLSWDKPGVGGSSGDWRLRTIPDRADEALDAVRWLRGQPEIDSARVGLWGHSQGGWIGPLAASQSPDVAFLIVNSGPGITPFDQDLYGVEHTLRRDGASEAEISDALAFMQALHDAASQQMSYEQVSATLLEPARGTPGATYFGEMSAEDWSFLVLNAQHPIDPVANLERVTCPVLAIFGERDPLVPAVESAAIFERALAGNYKTTIKVYPDADHRIRVGDPPEFVPGYITMMADWLAAHA